METLLSLQEHRDYLTGTGGPPGRERPGGSCALVNAQVSGYKMLWSRFVVAAPLTMTTTPTREANMGKLWLARRLDRLG